MSAEMRRSAARLCQYAGELIALVGSWQECWKVTGSFAKKYEPGAIRAREVTEEGLRQFEQLDAKLHAQMRALNVTLSANNHQLGPAQAVYGYTELVISFRRAINVDDWERRVRAAKEVGAELSQAHSPIEGTVGSFSAAAIQAMFPPSDRVDTEAAQLPPVPVNDAVNAEPVADGPDDSRPAGWFFHCLPPEDLPGLIRWLRLRGDCLNPYFPDEFSIFGM
jgi:hypothetical protein